MSSIFVLSYYMLWCCVVCLAIAVVYLLTRKPVPTPAAHQQPDTMQGLPISSVFPTLDLTDYGNNAVSLRSSLVIFSVTGCDVCKLLYGVLEGFKSNHPQLPIYILLFEEGPGEIQATLDLHQLTIPVIPKRMDEMGLYQTSLYPFAYTLNRNGNVIAKGNVNDEEHLLLMIEPLEEDRKLAAKAG
ncbi:TlpA family protein disulfide reductase [Paenibacillus paeoniae]|uniref:Thioredoxin domain-containing protein n=1 Tax=Paenibacillus paeoniae TaxID=2292705 RepID=A0A371PJ30_9BACL|nr:hypothetical protein [Paenibacillus paeoniae]REK75649.1 hypothetical protein DX130_00755 [Paenibacillus paeoniae]